jgi:hypothetical protein
LDETTKDVEFSPEMLRDFEKLKVFIENGTNLSSIDEETLGAFKMLKGLLDDVYIPPDKPEKKATYAALKDQVDAVVIPRSPKNVEAYDLLDRIIKECYEG